MKKITLISISILSLSVFAAVLWPNGSFLETFQNGFIFGNTSRLSVLNNILEYTDTQGATKTVKNAVESDKLVNASFESSYSGDPARGWTYTPSGADAAEIETGASNVIHGDKSFKITPASESFTLTQEIDVDAYAGNLIGFSVWVKSDVALEVCSMQNGSEIVCEAYTADSGYKEFKTYQDAVTGQDSGIRVKSDSSVTGTVYVDYGQFKVNPLTPTNIYENQGWTEYTPIFQGLAPSVTSVFYKRVGDSIVIRADITTGTTTGDEAQIGLPLGLTIDVSKFPLVTNVNTSSQENQTGSDFFPILATGGDSFLNIGLRNGGTSGGLTPQAASTIFGSGRQINFVTSLIPITEWEETKKGVIVKGELSTDLTNENIFSTKIGSAGAIGVGEDMLDWIQGDCVESPSATYTCTFNPAINFSIAPTCWVVQSGASQHAIISTSTTQVVYETRNAAGTLASVAAGIGCQRASSDYIKKSEVNVVLPEGIAPPTCYFSEQQPSGTNGGTFTSGAWRARTLNTTEGSCSFASLSANTITMGAGTYDVECKAPAYAVDQMKLRFRNTSDSTTAIVGTSTIADSANIIGAVSPLSGQITIAGSKDFVLQHFCSTTRSTNGFGITSSTGEVEVYATCKITKVR